MRLAKRYGRTTLSGESAFIDSLRALASHPAARGLDDDAAVLEIGHETLVLTHDSIVEGVHFLPDQDPADIAWKLIATNLSDLAAKGAEPVGALISHQLGGGDDRFAEGLAEVLQKYGVALLGGDTTRANGPRSLGATLVGSATHTPVPARSGAKPGDRIFVTGTLGRAMLGLEGGLAENAYASAYTRPVPLLAEGQQLAPLVSAMMDVSDGLLLDAWRMAKASNMTFQLISQTFPVADPARADDCVRWGDDYELLFTLPPRTACPVPATQIGKVEAKDSALLWVDNAILTPADRLGYRHERSAG
ncbi:thiamine-phosphate kinase [Pontixanthobacter sp.]|uniref:thiamine-phosphate kinase n=1 Tax=Pontixanthobacter sp. TaxID=2792078 RepID=UPI003C7CA9A2